MVENQNNKRRTLDERLALAANLHRQGYNCSQCVVMAFDDVTDADPALLAAAAAGLGGGVGGCGETCGVVTGMAIVNGLLSWGAPADKPAVYRSTRELAEGFAAHNGSLICRELKGPNARRPCSELIADGVRRVHHLLEQSGR